MMYQLVRETARELVPPNCEGETCLRQRAATFDFNLSGKGWIARLSRSFSVEWQVMSRECQNVNVSETNPEQNSLGFSAI
jgi:hypothetical protein